MLVVRGGGALGLAGQEDALRPPKYLFATACARACRQLATHVAATFFRTKGTVSAQSTPSCLPGFFAPKQNGFGLQDLPALSLRSGRSLRSRVFGGRKSPPFHQAHLPQQMLILWQQRGSAAHRRPLGTKSHRTGGSRLEKKKMKYPPRGVGARGRRLLPRQNILPPAH